MPITIKKTTGGEDHANPFVGPVNHPATQRIDVSALTTDEVDQNGYLKPGVPFKSGGVLLDGTVGEFVWGCVIEATKVADSNAAADLAAATDIDVALAVIGVVNRDIVEDNLGRALTANEIAGFGAAGSLLRLLDT